MLLFATATGDYRPNVEHSAFNTWHGRVIPASFLVPLRTVFALVALLTSDTARHSMLVSTCLGDMICLLTLVKLARNTQVASSYATLCISRTAILRAAVLFRRPSASRSQHTAAPLRRGTTVLAVQVQNCPLLS